MTPFNRDTKSNQATARPKLDRNANYRNARGDFMIQVSPGHFKAAWAVTRDDLSGRNVRDNSTTPTATKTRNQK